MVRLKGKGGEMSKRILELNRLTDNDEEYLDNLACIFKVSSGDEKQRMSELICKALDFLGFLFAKNPELKMIYRTTELRQETMSIIVLVDGLDDLDWIIKKFKISGSNQTEKRENAILFSIQQIREIAEAKR